MKVLVIAPHPDDESLGCGGTLLRHKAQGDEVSWLIMTSITEAHGYARSAANARSNEVDLVSEVYGFKKVFQLGLEPAGLDQYPLSNLVDKVKKVFDEINPELVYLPFPYDVHTDHKVTFEACFPCTKIFRQSSVKQIRCYETLSETEFQASGVVPVFQPNCYVNIEAFLEKKLHILNIYKTELGPPPFPRSLEAVKAQALLRGQVAGTNAAEAFMIIRSIES